jgi:hypothetical protein
MFTELLSLQPPDAGLDRGEAGVVQELVRDKVCMGIGR